MHAETKINFYFFLYNALTYKKHPNKSSSAEVKHIATLSLKIWMLTLEQNFSGTLFFVSEV